MYAENMMWRAMSDVLDEDGNKICVHIDLGDEGLDLHRRYAKRAIKIISGRNRNVFVMNNGYVVKVPKKL